MRKIKPITRSKGSDASKSLKDFSVKTSGKWSALYALGHEIDSLIKSGVPDSSSRVRSINEQGTAQLDELKKLCERIYQKFQ